MKKKYYPLRVLTSFLVDKKFEHECDNINEIKFFKGKLWTNISTRENCIHKEEIKYALSRLEITEQEFLADG